LRYALNQKNPLPKNPAKIAPPVADQQIKSVHWFQATDVVVLIFSPLIILAFV